MEANDIETMLKQAIEPITLKLDALEKQINSAPAPVPIAEAPNSLPWPRP